MRGRIAATVLIAGMTACSRVPSVDSPHPQTFTIRDLGTTAAASPLSEVRAGDVRAVFPDGWHARPLPEGTVPQEGFVASPRLDRFERATGVVQGMEAFWVDVGRLEIPSNYYYLAARNEAISGLTTSRTCRLGSREVLVDHPPDLTGVSFSPSDYVATATGSCDVNGRSTRWAYVVAAPGYGPIRQVGIPTSGLYVVIAVVSGPNADRLLKEMIEGATFGDTPISQIVRAAGQIQ